jgi:uncharacterized protein (DUF1684 family)
LTTTIAPTELSTAWTSWHAAREQLLTAEHGWLSLVGFHWLPAKPGSFDKVPGRWSVDGGHAVLAAAEVDGLLLASGPDEGAAVTGVLTASVAEAGSLLWVRSGTIVVELVLRGGRYAIRLRDPAAPERAAFSGVPAFPVDPSWIRPGHFTAYPQARRITVDTARSDLRQQVTAIGTVEVEIDGRLHSLVATAGQRGRLNLSFTDRTNGQQTARWRVVSTSVPTEKGSLVVDFNRAVNLPFSFTEFGTCPAPVAGNDLPLPVTAGERAPIRVTGAGAGAGARP